MQSPGDRPDETSTARERGLRWVWIAVAILPFQLPLLHHLWSAGPLATGFLGYDTPYYVANGRAVFEHGNGFFSPNPYDSDPTSPAIYFHLFTWLLGLGVKVFGVDPGFLFAGVGLVASFIGGALTLRLVEAVLPERRGRLPLFVLTMWSGGMLCFGALVVSWSEGRLTPADWFGLDLPNGWWFPNWGRNFILSHEAFYHLFAAATWLGVVLRRWPLAFGALGVLAACHPFSGIQHLLIVGAWVGILALRERTLAAWGRVLVVGAMLAIFAAYYFLYLDSFPGHRAVRDHWLAGWQLPLSTVMLGILPPVGIAAWKIWRQRGRLGERDGFFLTAGLVTLLLMKHDWFLAPHQPAHFSRGYNWLPFWLIALPQLQTWSRELASLRPRILAGVIVTLGVAGLFFDNAVFTVREWKHGEVENEHLTLPQREALAWMDRAKLRGVLLCADARLSYLSATYSGVRPYLGHLQNTPNVIRHGRDVAGWQRRGETGEWFRLIDYVLIDRHDPPAAFDSSPWRELYRNEDYILLGRVDSIGGK